ncbi:MAG: hypothetical protein ACRDPL_00135 [Propionibacteriaceae bacterium]
MPSFGAAFLVEFSGSTAASPGDAFVASLTGVEPGVEDAHSVIESVSVADADERLSAGGRAGTGESIERGDGKLRLRERHMFA